MINELSTTNNSNLQFSLANTSKTSSAYESIATFLKRNSYNFTDYNAGQLSINAETGNINTTFKTREVSYMGRGRTVSSTDFTLKNIK